MNAVYDDDSTCDVSLSSFSGLSILSTFEKSSVAFTKNGMEVSWFIKVINVYWLFKGSLSNVDSV